MGRVIETPPEAVGRDADVAQLREALVGGSAGSSMLVLTGESGVGKSTLLGLVANDLAGLPLRVCCARGMPWESDRPGGVLAQLGLDGQAADRAAGDPVGTARVLDEFFAGAPTVVLCDDADLADEASIEVLSSLVRHFIARPYAVLLAAADPARFDRLGAREMRLRGLDAVDLVRLAVGRGIELSQASARALRRHTNGNIGDAVALLDRLPAEVWAGSAIEPDLPAPPRLRARVESALADVCGETTSMVRALAVLGGSARLETTIRAAALDCEPGPRVLAVADRLRATGLLGPTAPTELRLADARLARAILDTMTSAQVADLHLRAAEIADDEPGRLEHLAAAASGPDDDLATRLDRAARELAGDGRWSRAARVWEIAARLSRPSPARDERLIRSLDALVAAGDLHAATAVMPVVEALRETALRDEAMAYLAIARGRREEAEIRLARASDIVSERDPEVAGLIAQRKVLHALAECRPGDLVGFSDEAIGFAGPDSPAGIEAAAIRGLGVAAGGSVAKARASYDELVRNLPNGAHGQRVAMGRGWLELTQDAIGAARVALESALPAQDAGSVRIGLWAQAWLARLQLMTGEWADCRATLDRGLALVDSSGLTLIEPLLRWTSAELHELQGFPAAADADLRAAERYAGGYQLAQVANRLARAALAESRNDFPGVLRALEPLTDPAADSNLDAPGFWPWQHLFAHALVLTGAHAQAAEFLDRHEKLAGDHVSTGARLGWVRGRLLAATGDLDAAQARFTASIEALETIGLRYDAARARCAYGQALRRAGRRRQAESVLVSVRETFLDLGASTMVDLCDRELKSVVSQVKSAESDAGTGLTTQESSIADLVSQGMSNKEVAATLYLSPKTVQYHLSRIYAKLTIRSRAELAAWWREASPS